MRKKIMYGSILLCIVLWIIAIPNMDYFIEFMINDTFIMIQYNLIPIILSSIVAVGIIYGLIKKKFIM